MVRGRLPNQAQHKPRLGVASCFLRSLFHCAVLLASLVVLNHQVMAEEISTPLFQLYTADGLVGSGPLEQLGEDWSVSLGGKKPLQVKGGNIVALRQVNLPLPPAPGGACIIFTNGDQLAGTPLQVSGERVRFQACVGADQELLCPLSTIAFVWFAAPERPGASPGLRHRLASEQRSRDTLLLRNGDTVEGTLTALDAATIYLDDTHGKEVRIARDKITALALSTELARSVRPHGVYARLVLANGGRLSLLAGRLDGPALVGKTLFGASVRVPVKQIVALDLCQGCALYLSDLKPRAYEHTPYLGVHWPYTRDLSVAGNALRVGQSTYDKGIGMHSQSRLTFDLGGRYRWFEAVVGLDETTGREGSVFIQVLVDGQARELPAAGELTSQSKPLPVRVPLAGARELTLVVLFGRHGDVQDHVNWANARLIK